MPLAENTLPSFRYGMSHGADIIEMDVHLSRDGVPMVIHDPTLDRTTDGTGRIVDYTRQELLRFDAAKLVTAPRYAVQVYIPTFAQVMDLLNDNTVRAEVEIKVPPWGRYVGIEEKVINEIVDRNLVERVQVSSFDFDVLKDVKRVNPKIKTVALMTVDFFRRVPVNQPLKVIDAVQAVNADLIAVNKDWLTAVLVPEAHQRDLKVEVWTVDDESEMRKFIQMGVDGIITNQPDVLKQIVSK